MLTILIAVLAGLALGSAAGELLVAWLQLLPEATQERICRWMTGA